MERAILVVRAGSALWVLSSILGLYTLDVNSRRPLQFMGTLSVSARRQVPPPGGRLPSPEVRRFDH